MLFHGAALAIKGEELWPDLILIDGGLGHLRAAQKALDEMNAPEVKIASIFSATNIAISF